VVIDRYSKIAYYTLYRKDITAEDLADLFLRDVFRLYSILVSIVTDRGTLF
ncbi:hypothetical protein SMMN14_06862, partial [Sphaerulina musiva]